MEGIDQAAEPDDPVPVVDHVPFCISGTRVSGVLEAFQQKRLGTVFRVHTDNHWESRLSP